MKRIRIPRGFTLDGLFVFIALFCVSTYAFFEDMTISILAFTRIKLPLLYVGFVCLVLQIKTIFGCLLKKNRFYTLLILAILCVLLIISMFMNLDATIGGSPLRYTFRLLLYLVEAFLLMIVIAEKGLGKAAIRFLAWYLLIIVAVNDVLMFTRIVEFRVGRFETYMVGNKFSVSYLHMNLLTMWMLRWKLGEGRRRIPWWLVLCIAAGIVAVTIRVDCKTGLIGCTVLVVLAMLMENRRWIRIVRFTSPWILLAALLGSVVFAFVAQAIVENPLVEYFLEDVLNRDTSLTGRTNIYKMYVDNLQGNWLTGYGYGNGNEVAVALFGYETMQNGLLQWVLEIGLPGTIAMVVLLWQVFRVVNSVRETKKRGFMPVVALIYTFIILGTVEADFNMMFFLWFALIYMLATERLPIANRALR